MSKNGDIYSKKRIVGHSDEKKRIRKKDGWIFKGEEFGYVDEDGQVREKDGWIGKGNKIGEIEGNKAKANDGLIFKGEEFGYVDGEGNIRLKDGMFLRGRIIGRVSGKNIESSLAFFMLKFKKLEDQCDALESDFDSEPEKGKCLGRIRKMLDYVPKADALGDFDSLIRKLKDLESKALDELNKNLKQKESLCREAEELSESTEWREAHERLKQMRNEWKEIGFVPKEKVAELWDRFNRAIDLFYKRRQQYFEERDREQQVNLDKKKDLIYKILDLAETDDWRSASSEVKQIQVQWKTVGPVPKAYIADIRNDYRSALDRFYTNCNDYFERQKEERQQKKEQWLERMAEKIARLEAKVESLEESIQYDRDKIDQYQNTIWNLRPGGRAEEIKSNLEDKIDSRHDRIASKQTKISDIRETIYELKQKRGDL